MTLRGGCKRQNRFRWMARGNDEEEYVGKAAAEGGRSQGFACKVQGKCALLEKRRYRRMEMLPVCYRVPPPPIPPSLFLPLIGGLGWVQPPQFRFGRCFWFKLRDGREASSDPRVVETKVWSPGFPFYRRQRALSSSVRTEKPETFQSSTSEFVFCLLF